MAGFTIARHIDAPPERVFAAATDFPNLPEVVRGIKKVEMLTSGPVGAGTRFAETRVVFKREATETLEVTAFDPPRSCTLGCESHGCRFQTRFRFTPEGSGTRVEVEFEAQPLTFVAKFLGILTRPMIKMCSKEIAKDLEDLQAHLGGSDRSGAAAGATG